MKTWFVTALFPVLCFAQDPKVPSAAAAEPAETAQVAPLAARDVIERLKSVRSEIVLEEEQIRLLKARLERVELEIQLSQAEVGQKPTPNSPAGGQRPRGFRPRPAEDTSIVVKAVTTRPFKEAIVTYRGRVYTVRPGDKLGDVEIRDVTETGVVTNASSGNRPVLMGR